MAETDVTTKLCHKCGILKAPGAFLPKRRVCHQCYNLQRAQFRTNNAQAIKAKKARYYRKNASHIKAAAAAYRIVNKDRIREKSVIKYAKNKEQIQAKISSWVQANKAIYKANRAAYQKANLDRFTVYRNSRRARKRAATGSFTKDDIVDIRRMQRDRCAICRTPLKRSGDVDHIVALFNGGTNDRRNLQILCEPCNSRKGAKDPIDFMRSRGLLL